MSGELHFPGLREERPLPGNEPERLPKMPILGGALESIAQRAESILHAVEQGVDLTELNRLREEGLARILEVEEARPEFVRKLDDSNALAIFREGIEDGFVAATLIQDCFQVMLKLRPLAAGLIQRSLID